MAKIEIANILHSELEWANTSATVGVGEKNEMNDVMLIQALFKLVGYDDRAASIYFDLSLNDLPEPTGNFDKKTINAIWGFQRKMKYRLLSLDGKIHPANYKNRVIKNLTFGKLMTMTLLNWLGMDGASGQYMQLIPALKSVAPQLILKPIDSRIDL